MGGGREEEREEEEEEDGFYWRVRRRDVKRGRWGGHTREHRGVQKEERWEDERRRKKGRGHE